MKHVECNMKHSLCEAKIDKPCNKLVITWLFRAIWYIFFEILVIARARSASAIKKSRKIYNILHEQSFYN